ncbi:hypothetical protein PG993_006296 [Apiospora rasikravindrae]|uniref:FAD linked oxidase N-terminal domain-containing protein n=1 Tax=Apiospora rasikravindrae TaxID=990691 RepID=A0ABR1T5B7_9PEZI
MSLRVASESVVSDLARGGLEEILSPAGSTRYDERVSSYFSLTAQKKLYCFVQPKPAEQVSQILKSLLAHPDARFAIRGGGHVM